MSDLKLRSLRQWVWLAYVRAALIPLMCVELALIGAYMFSHNWSRDERIQAVEVVAKGELGRLIVNHVSIIEQQLEGVQELTELLRQETVRVVNNPDPGTRENPARYTTGNGALYTNKNDGGAAVFFSGFKPLSDKVKERITQTSRLDPLLKQIVDINPFIIQAYFNTHDSLNRIWPYFDVLSQYPLRMDIPSYNFYYEADQAHNPKRATTWIDAYLDPAGQGWMVSCISPVYRGDFLEGVVGVDITLEVIIQKILGLPIPWDGFAVLISKDGTVIAMPKQAEKIFNLEELTHHSYSKAVDQETLKPSSFNINQRPDLAQLSKILNDSHGNISKINFDQPYLVASEKFAITGWQLFMFVPEAKIFEPAKVLAERLTLIGWYLLLGLAFFYVLFFMYLYSRSLSISRMISRPLLGIQKMAQQIGEGNFNPDVPAQNVFEFQSTVDQMLATAKKLEQAERQLIDSKSIAEQASYAKSTFLANMSHEIRTPLTAIVGLSELAEDQANVSAYPDFLSKIHKASQALLIVVNDILDFSKIEARKIELDNKPFEIHKLIEDSIGILSHSIDEKGLDLKIAISERLPVTLVGDYQRIRQVLVNLLGNAVKFTKKGGLTLDVDCVSHADNMYQVRFVLSDTGIGIAEDNISELFLAFNQADVSISRKFGGTGLGLAICDQLLQLMRGRLYVSSALGVGSKFAFVLPLPKAPTIVNGSDGGPHSRSADSSVLKGRRVLLVEDVAINQQVALAFLRKAGLVVEVANHGLEAVELVKSRHFDAVLMDIQMPEMDGFEATKVIRQLDGCRDLPIIAMTAAAMEHDKEACIAAGMNDHLSKPINFSQLVDILLRWIQAQAQAPIQNESTVAQQTTDFDLPGFDFGELIKLFDGDIEQVKDLLNIFIEDFSHADLNIKAAIDKLDYQNAHVLMHQMKGVSGNIGATELHKISEKCDNQFKAGTIDPAAFNEWLTVFNQTLETINRLLSS